MLTQHWQAAHHMSTRAAWLQKLTFNLKNDADTVLEAQKLDVAGRSCSKFRDSVCECSADTLAQVVHHLTASG